MITTAIGSSPETPRRAASLLRSAATLAGRREHRSLVGSESQS
jgi:hypothetical protein